MAPTREAMMALFQERCEEASNLVTANSLYEKWCGMFREATGL